ncbi:hypothetical protein Clacol_006073 [Clathrus columnatus]|uniref:DUF6593 domain-containing protein n=1 Tax=Clathrus columnatus TaxID=1419009 RepID=A0AAV5ABW0_9AGAM|nr:hypothetical protein Clacol_006073 [Clathrus columnatus]
MPPPPKPPPPFKLTFTTTSLRNVTIATENDAFYYEIVTRHWEPSITRINRLDVESGKMIPKAELLKDEEDRDAPYTGIKFIDPEKPDTSPIPPNIFLGLEGASKNALGKFTSKEGTRYRWQESDRTIELTLIDDPDKKPAAVVLERDADFYKLVSFLLAEGKRRD